MGVPTNPVQDKAAVSGLLVAFETTLTVAVRAPATVGAQLTVTEQFCPADTVPQVSEMVKSPGLEPVSVTGCVTTRFAFPMLDTVMFCAPLTVVV